jgi:superfamily I DNA/RNA helicase
MSVEETELAVAIERVLNSTSRKKLVIAGPGTGKTSLFRKMLELDSGEPSRRIVLTFINNLKNDLEADLAGLARVFTLHSYCLGLMHRHAELRAPLSSSFHCCPGLASLIAQDWAHIHNSEAPQFVGEMRKLAEENHIPFYLARGEYYDAVDFDDTVYRVLASNVSVPDNYDLVLIDEYQDFNRLEAELIDVLGQSSPIIIAGDDDQALYSQLRGASWDYIRRLTQASEYEVFNLPFCMRCPKVVVDAVSDILTKAQELRKLEGRIEKPYKYFPPVKGADSAKYPKIALVETSVQRQGANYMGRYIAQATEEIPPDEIEAAANGGYPVALVIVAQPYRDQIIRYLESVGFVVDTRREAGSKLDRELGLSILKEDRDSNLGWRVILSVDTPPFLADIIAETVDGAKRLVDILPDEFRDSVLADVDTYEPPEETSEGEQGTTESVESLSVRVTSFEGAKGLSAQHVFIAGLHNHELPHDPRVIQDLEICKFVVGLTRTRKKCSLIYTRNFAGQWKTRSSFVSWIDSARLDFIKVDAAYWKKQVANQRTE